MNHHIKNCFRPLSFQVNRGQSAPEVKFLAQSTKHNLLFTPSETVIMLRPSATPAIDRTIPTQSSLLLKFLSFFKRLRPASDNQPSSAVVRLKFSGANENPEIIGVEKLPGKVNYFIGNDPANWRTDIPTYAKVKYRNVYPGIDIVYYSANQQQLEWDFIVHPGANPDLITLDFDGSEQLILDAQGDLLLTAVDQQIRISKPVVYQKAYGQRSEVSGSYILISDHQVRFRLADYDPGKPLIIDPIITYSTYLGGSTDDLGYGIAVDAAGNFYVTGVTYSIWTLNPYGFPIEDPYQANNPGYYNNAFITKIDAAGTLVYSTYLGGTGADTGASIAVDAAGNAYVTGTASSTDFPIYHPIQGSNNGSFDVFVTKLNPEGNALVYSTYLGGMNNDFGYSIAVDSAGNAYVTGSTESAGTASPPGFPTANPIQPDNNSVFPGSKDAFVTKINANGALVYSTYLGGWKDDIGYAIAVDPAGNAYVTGSTASSPPLSPLKGFPITPLPFQNDFGGTTDAFVTRINADGSLGYSSYLGGKNYDEGRSIAVDSAGYAYVTGYTASRRTEPPGFPTLDPLQPDNNGNFDAFVTKIAADGHSLIYSTYLGGTNDDRGYGIAVDSAGNAYVTGYTNSSGTSAPPGFPTSHPIQANNNGPLDAFITKIKSDGTLLLYSTYLGGKGSDVGLAITIDSANNAYVTGYTWSTWAVSPFGPPGFPVKNHPIQADNYGSSDVFVLKLASLAALSITKSASPDPVMVGQNLIYQIVITNNGPDPATELILTDQLSPHVDFISSSTGCSQTGGIVTCNLDMLETDSSVTFTIVVRPKRPGVITNTATITSDESSPVSVTIVTQALQLPGYTNITMVRDWRKNPPRFM